MFRRLDEVGLTTVGACGDAVRNVTGCPVAGLAHDELFDVTPVIEEVTKFFYGNPDYSDLPRKHKITISACAHRCNAPEINCIALVGAIRDGEQGFAVLVGGGLSSVPRLAATSASSSGSTRRCPSCARCSTPGRKTCATASRA